MEASKIELVLDGLDCAVCAAKINDKVNNIEDVKEATLNFASKIMTIELESVDKKENVVKHVTEIVHKIEPDVTVSEKLHDKYVKKTLILEGLDCANCALKIEGKIKELDSIKSANVDFTTGKLNIETKNRDLETAIMEMKL